MTTYISSKTCTIKGCTNRLHARDLCNNHYQQLRRRLAADGPAKPTICSIDDCTNPHHARSWCIGHYGNWKRTGNPVAVAVEQISRDHVIYLRRLVGLPDDGPTAEQIVRWRAEEGAEELGVAS